MAIFNYFVYSRKQVLQILIHNVHISWDAEFLSYFKIIDS